MTTKKNVFGLGSMESMMSNMFRKVENIVWDMTTNSIGIIQDDGIYTISINHDDLECSAISINPFDQMSMRLPAYAMSTPVAAIEAGDMIINNKGGLRGWVLQRKANNTFRIMTVNGNISTWNPPQIQMLGFDSGVMVVRSLMKMAGGTQGVNQMQQMMQMMVMSGMMDDESDMDSMMPMMLMSVMGGANPMGGMFGQATTGEDGAVQQAANPMMGGMNMMQMMPMMMMMKKLGK